MTVGTSMLKPEHLIFGPVPSRRLGKSLGINNIPPKICSYSCIYCQLGNTLKMQVNREKYFETGFIIDAVKKKIDKAEKNNSKIDYLAFVPDGEPTLDANLGATIAALKEFDIPVAVISNSSMIFLPEVQASLYNADWVSLKIDTVNESLWHEINRPHGIISIDQILQSIFDFRNIFRGTLATETMLLEGLNDNQEDLQKLAEYLHELKPDLSYISVPTRPTAIAGVSGSKVESRNLAYQIINNMVPKTEFLSGYEGNDFSTSGDAKADILSISAVHPLREDAVENILIKNSSNWSVVNGLLKSGQLKKVAFDRHFFYLCNLNRLTH